MVIVLGSVETVIVVMGLLWVVIVCGLFRCFVVFVRMWLASVVSCVCVCVWLSAAVCVCVVVRLAAKVLASSSEQAV